MVKAKIRKIVQYLDDILNFKDRECIDFQGEKRLLTEAQNPLSVYHTVT